MNKKELLRSLPKIDELLKEDKVQVELEGNLRVLVLEALREAIESFRGEILKEAIESFTKEDVLELFENLLEKKKDPKLKPIINATGVVIHTNLGRSLLCKEAVESVVQVASHYNNLEYDLDKGKRGSRYAHIEEIIKKITGAEAAMVVNNNAAAVMLVLNTLCKDKEAIVSRGQLVEIGGSFRVPDVMRFSGAHLVEVGTTNRTHLYDYENNINECTGVLLKVHTSNFKIIGFTEEVSLEELVLLAEKNNIPVVEDIGSGSLIDFSKYGLTHEPTVQESIKKGIHVVTFSGDKMLGGPQAGIIAGKKVYIDEMKKNQLTRALRIDKMTLAALEATLNCYLEEEKAIKEIPTLYMMTSSKEEHKKRAQRLKSTLQRECKDLEIKIEEDYSMVGGGSMPGERIESYVLKLKSKVHSAESLEKKLRNYKIPIIVRVYNGEVVLDVRTIANKEFEIIKDCLKNL